MELIAKRKLHDTDITFIDKIKKDMLIQLINHICDKYPELMDKNWIKHSFHVSKNFTEIKLVISIFTSEVQ